MKREINQDLERVFNTYYNILYKAAVIMLCNEQDASDSVQETFIKYLEYKKEFHDPEHEKAWLLRVNINICKNMIRFHRLHPTITLDMINLSYQDQKDYELMSALLRIRKQAKEVLILHFIEGYRNKEIASILGISENAVKKRLQRAKKELIQEYDKRGEERDGFK